MTAQEKKQQLLTALLDRCNNLTINSKLITYVTQYLKECNIHQLQNLNQNFAEFTKFITKSH